MQVDIGLAKEVAERPEDDEPLRRKLWLTIARHLVDGGKDSRDQGDKIRQARASVLGPACPWGPGGRGRREERRGMKGTDLQRDTDLRDIPTGSCVCEGGRRSAQDRGHPPLLPGLCPHR